MRGLKLSATAFLLVSLGWWLFSHGEERFSVVQDYVNNSNILTLEARFSPEQILESFKKERAQGHSRPIRAPTLKFYPYLLMEVKYRAVDRQPKDGVILWGMADGEMVINTETWETTRGFDAAIEKGTSRGEFRILLALSRHGGVLSREALVKELHGEPDLVEGWIASALQKSLIVQKGNQYQLPISSPKLSVTPHTKITQWLVTKPYSHAARMERKFTKPQIEKVAKAAFGQDFSVQNMKEVFLPVYCLEAVNPDGSLITSYWNALNGKKLSTTPLIQ